MTALANLEALARRVLDDNHAFGHTTPETLNAIEAALSPAELGGVGEPLRVFSEGAWVYEETGQRFRARDLDEAAFAEYLRHPLPTPRAAEAISLVDIGLCNWAAHILSDPERFNTRANDASAAIRRLVAALTPPSAKGE